MSMRLFVFSAFVCAAHHCQASTVLFSTDGTATPGFNASGALSLSLNHLEEIQFSATTTGTIGSLVIAAETDPATTQAFDILTDNAGTPGTLIDIISIVVPGGNIPAEISGNSTMNGALIAGNIYWISPEAQTGNVSWIVASPPVNLLQFFNNQPFFGVQPAGAFALVSSASVPEPGSIALIGGQSGSASDREATSFTLTPLRRCGMLLERR